MRIALALHTLDPASGGVTSATLQLACALSHLGHTITLLSFDPPTSPHTAHLPSGISHLALGPAITRYSYIPQLAHRLRSHTHSFDILLLNGLWLHSTAGVAAWAQQHRIPYVLFPHGMLDPYFARATPLKHLRKLLYWILVERHTVAHARALLYTTASEMSLAPKTFPFFHPLRQEVVGLGLASSPTPLSSARQAFLSAFPVLHGRPYLLYLGRFHPKKGADLLLSALHHFPQLTLVMAGPLRDIHPRFLSHLRSLATPQVIWTDLLTGPLKWGALAQASAFILPSHQENFGMAVAESLSVGTPALVSDKVALADDILASSAGFVAPDTLAGTRDLLQRFTALTPDAYASLRQNALACYQAHYQPAAVAQRLQQLLSSLL